MTSIIAVAQSSLSAPVLVGLVLVGVLGGVVDISSEVGIGTKMTITLPITLAIISVLMLEVAGRTFCMPLASVEEAIVFDDAMIRTFEGKDVPSRGRFRIEPETGRVVMTELITEDRQVRGTVDGLIAGLVR